MSYDRKLDWICPHHVVEEALFVTNDRLTARPGKPISSADSVRVRVNGEVDVGPMGYQVPAEVSGSKQGPFTITPSVSDTLVFKINEEPPGTIILPAGRELSAGQVAGLLTSRIPGVSFEAQGQRIAAKTRRKGPSAVLMFLPGSTLASVVGFAVNRQWRGRTTVPGWSLIHDPNTLTDRPTRIVLFDEALKSASNYVELSYATVRQECRRCGGLGIENDWRYNRNGEVVQVRDEALLIQEIQKMIYTAQGSNRFHSWIGTNILEVVGKKLSASGIIQQFVTADIREAFRRWQNVKKQQELEYGQVVSDSEYPFNLLQVTMTQSQKDPTIVFTNVVVQNRSSKPIQIERGVRLPLPDDILGSSAQDGLTRQSLSNFVLSG